MVQSNVVAALPIESGALHVPFESYTLALYPYIDGLDATKQPFNPTQLTELGRILARLHGIKPPIKPRAEPFDITHRADCLRVLDSLPTCAASDDPYQRELASVLLPVESRLRQELANFEAAAESAQRQNAPYVLCHSDPSIGNTMAAGDQIYVIDWDGIILAPKERDLMHFGADDQPKSTPASRAMPKSPARSRSTRRSSHIIVSSGISRRLPSSASASWRRSPAPNKKDTTSRKCAISWIIRDWGYRDTPLRDSLC